MRCSEGGVHEEQKEIRLVEREREEWRVERRGIRIVEEGCDKKGSLKFGSLWCPFLFHSLPASGFDVKVLSYLVCDCWTLFFWLSASCPNIHSPHLVTWICSFWWVNQTLIQSFLLKRIAFVILAKTQSTKKTKRQEQAKHQGISLNYAS